MERAEKLLAERKRDDARAGFERAAQVDPRNPDLLSRIGKLIAEDGDPAGGEPYVTRAMELAPARADLVALRAWIRGCLMDYQGTIDDCDVALRLDPNPYWVWENRAWAKEILGDKEGAAADIREAIRRAPPHSSRIDELKKHLGELEKKESP
jgi:tetratricopeptide (TPR) repeat protein